MHPATQPLATLLRFEELVPPRFAAYTRWLAGGLEHFLECLRPDRRAAIRMASRTLPESAPAALRLVALLRACPTLHKLGQVLARQEALDAELRSRLQTLESLPPTTPLEELAPALNELARDPAFADFRAERVLAEGSVAQVVAVSFFDKAVNGRTTAAAKLLKAGVREQLHEELHAWQRVGAFLEATAAEADLPIRGVHDAVARVATLLRSEVDLHREREHMRAAATLSDSYPGLRVPRVFEFDSRDALVMEFVHGQPLLGAALDAEQRRRAAARIVEALLVEPMFSTAPSTGFHADPHGGNLFADGHGRVWVLDWSLVGRLHRGQRAALAQAALGGLLFDAPRVCRAVDDLAVVPPAAGAVRRVVEQALAQRTRGARYGLAWLCGLLDAIATTGAAQLAPDLMLLRKSLLLLEGVVRDLRPEAPLEAIAAAPIAERLLRELPRRWLSPLFSRDLPSGLSSMDLWLAAWQWPLGLARAAWAG